VLLFLGFAMGKSHCHTRDLLLDSSRNQNTVHLTPNKRKSVVYLGLNFAIGLYGAIQIALQVREKELELVRQQTANSDYEDLLHQYATQVNSTQLSVAAISDKISADSVEQLTELLHDSQVYLHRLHSTLHSFY